MPDIESVVSAVELLAERDEVELAPFVQRWDPSVDALESPRPYLRTWAADIHKALLDPQRVDQNLLGRGLTNWASTELNIGPPGEAFHFLLIELVQQLSKHLTIKLEASTDYLRPLASLGGKTLVSVATLNYDLAVETAARRIGVNCSTGLDAWNDQWRLEWPESGIKLMKLHGSIDWRRDVEPRGLLGAARGISHTVVAPMSSPTGFEAIPFVRYGRREKLRPDGPFLDLRAAFVEELRSATHLVVLGYSFADNHINELVLKWVNSDPHRLLVVVDPNFPETWPRATGMQQLLLQGLQEQDGADIARILSSQLVVLRESAAEALPKVCAGPAHLNELRNASLTETTGD